MTDVREIDPRELNDLYLTDLMPVDVLQRIQDAFSNMAGKGALAPAGEGEGGSTGADFTE